MYKNMFKRSWLSIKRKPSRSIILIALLFVMANLLLATLSIMNSVAKSTQHAKDQISGVVYLQPDTEALMKKAEESGENTRPTSPTISLELAQAIAKSQFIKDYTYSVSTTGNASNFEVVETTQNERERQFRGALNDAKNQASEQIEQFNESRSQFNEQQNGSSMGGQRSPQFNFNLNFDFQDPTVTRGDTTVQGINSFSFVSDVENGSMKIVSGEAFNEETKNGVVISQELAEANGLKVGGELKLKSVSDEAVEITYTIVGIYENSSEDFNNNTIYTNISGAKELLTEEQQKNLTVQNVRYYLTSAEDKDAFINEMEKTQPTIASSNLKLDIDDSAYQTMVGPIEQVGGFATTIFWIVILATVVIITLIVIINVKDRRYEMGVLLSLGAKRMSIIGQIVIELVVVATVGFLLSFGTSQLISQKIGDEMLKQQIASTQSSDNSVGGERRGLNAPGRLRSQQSNVKQIDSIDVSPGIKEYALLFGIGFLIIIVAMIIPSINILRYQPKTILTGKE